MKEQFLPFEHCKMLKELAFDEPCIAYFFDAGGYACVGEGEEWLMTKQNSTLKKKNIAMPLWQQVEEWLWDKHKLYLKLLTGFFGFQYTVYYDKEADFKCSVIKSNPIAAHREGIIKAVEYLHSQLKK